MDQNEHGITGHPPGRLIRRGARCTLALTACAGLALGTGAPAHAASPNTASLNTAATAVTAVAAPSARTVTLPTGDRVTVTTVSGRTAYSVTGPAGSATAYVSYQDATGDHYIVPDEARPYLGRQLDKSLFDVSALLRAGATTGAHIPVSLSYPTGTTPSIPPGVTVTSSVGSTATGTVSTGYLTSASGASLAAGLRAAIGADVTAGRQPGTGALFGGLATLGLAVPGSVPGSGAVQPRFPLHILQITATDMTGAPADGALIFLLNVDSVSRENGFVPVGAGLARIAVPAGNYSMDAQFVDFDTAGNATAIRTVVVDDFSVSATAPTSTAAFDERTATVPFSVTVPRPATPDGMQISWDRQDAAGTTASFGTAIFGGGIPYFSNSQPAPAVGKLHYVVQWDAAGPATGAQYRYDVAFGTSDLPANQTYNLRPRDLATVHHTFYTDPAAPGGGSFLNGTFDGPGAGVSEISGSEAYSGPVTQYLGTGDGGQWAQSFFAANGVQYQADVHTYLGGHDYRVEWVHGPLAPDVGQHTGPLLLFPCMACASGGTLETLINPIGDSEPDHLGLPFFGGRTSHFTLYQNGTVVADSSTALGAELTGVPVAPTVYRLVYDTDRTGVGGVSQSVTTHTDITFRYVPDIDPRDTLPASDRCDFSGTMTQPCQVLPVLNLNYHLFTDTANTSGSEVQAMRLDVGHLTYDGHGSHAPITSATVSVSFDGGKTWKRARVAGAFGDYFAFWKNPASAAGTSPELRVTATDSAGGSISQTVTSAYTIAASVH